MFLKYASVGVLAGFLSGLFGVGGGILIVPGLLLVAKMEQKNAHGTSLAATLPISAASLLTYWNHGNVNWGVALPLAVGAVLGAIFGTKLLVTINKKTLAYSFSAILIVSAIRLFLTPGSTVEHALTLWSVLLLFAIGAVSGVLAGLLGVGGGVVMVPAMMILLGLPPVIAKGTSVAVIIPTAITGTIRNRSNKNVNLKAAAFVGCTGIISAVAGGYLSDAISDSLSNFLFGSLLTVVALRLFVQTVRQPKSVAV
jgi:uncharacterized membrane protein YfcA